MATHISSGGSHSKLNDAIGTIPTQTPPTYFNTPAFRTKIVEILAQTANGCLKELNYHPRMAQEVAELRSRIDRYREENSKLYDDNKRLLLMFREAEKKLGANSITINQLEQQITALHKTNHDILIRERNLAAGIGYAAYNQLHSEYMQLSGYSTQLKHQIGALQRIILEKPPLQRVSGPVRQPCEIAEGGKSLPVKQSAAHPTQWVAYGPQGHASHVQSHTIASGQGRQSQKVVPSVSRPPVVPSPGPLRQSPNINNNASRIPEPTSSQPATHSTDLTKIRALDTVGPAPRITGWVSPHAAETWPRAQSHSPFVVSVHQGRNASAQLQTQPSTPAAGSIVAQVNTNTPPSVIVRPPDVNVPPGMNFVPIGPPGKLLPPLAASVMKQPSPLSRPPSAHASLPSRTIDLPEPPPLDTSVPVAERSRTPNLTPTSSRNSAAPSDGELEATTPLDDHVNHTVKVVKSPINDVGAENSMMMLEEAMTTSTLKRRNLDIHDDEGENPSDVGESARKRAKMNENLPSEQDEDGKTIPTNLSLRVPEEYAGNEEQEEQEEQEEEEEFGPDGKRSVGYCLDVFTEEDGDVVICSLCRLRQESGLISAPTTFSLNTTQETKVQHFLDEHPTAWDNMITGKGCS